MEVLQVVKYAVQKEMRELRNAYPPPSSQPTRRERENELRRDEMVTPTEAPMLARPGHLDTLLQLVHEVHGDCD